MTLQQTPVTTRGDPKTRACKQANRHPGAKNRAQVLVVTFLQVIAGKNGSDLHKYGESGVGRYLKSCN